MGLPQARCGIRYSFEKVLTEAHGRVPLRILSYVVMGNHWHSVVWAKRGKHEQLSDFFR